MYQVLVAKIAGKRDQLNVVLEHYHKVSAVSNVPQVAKWAVLLALLMKDQHRCAGTGAALSRSRIPPEDSPWQTLALALLRNGCADQAAE